MATYGLTSSGWLSKPLAQIATEIDTGLQKILGASAGTNPDGTIPITSMAGQLKTLIVDGLSSQWDLLQGLASSFDPSQAAGISLDQVGSISGAKRRTAGFSTVIATCTGVPNTPLPTGRVLTVDVTASRFDSQSATNLSDPNYPASTIAALPAFVSLAGYPAGTRLTNGGNCYICTIGGGGDVTGPTGTTLGVDIVTGSMTWRFLGPGTGAVDVPFTAEAAGPIGANANALHSIATPISGWAGATNLLAAVPGQNQESDPSFRVRRDAELALTGNTTVDAVRAALLALNQGSTDPSHLPITSVTILWNKGDTLDANGLPPHSIECIVQGGTPQDIGQTIWDSVGAGIATYGTNQTTPVTDSQGNAQTVLWTRPTAVPIYIVATVWYNAADWPASGAAAAVNAYALSALLTFGLTYPTGQTVRVMPLGASVIDGPAAVDPVTGVQVVPAPSGSTPAPGILDVSPLNIGTAPAPGTSTPVVIGVRQIATFDASHITFTCIAEAP